MKWILTLLLILPLSCLATDWDRTDYALATSAVGTLAIDWGQTRYIAKHPHDYRETNPILGDHPSMGRVNTYFIGAIAGTILIGDYLSPRNRKLFFGTITAVELAVINHNRNIGIKISF